MRLYPLCAEERDLGNFTSLCECVNWDSSRFGAKERSIDMVAPGVFGILLSVSFCSKLSNNFLSYNVYRSLFPKRRGGAHRSSGVQLDKKKYEVFWKSTCQANVRFTSHCLHMAVFDQLCGDAVHNEPHLSFPILDKPEGARHLLQVMRGIIRNKHFKISISEMFANADCFKNRRKLPSPDDLSHSRTRLNGQRLDRNTTPHPFPLICRASSLRKHHLSYVFVGIVRLPAITRKHQVRYATALAHTMWRFSYEPMPLHEISIGFNLI